MRDGVWTRILKNPGSIVSRRLAKGGANTGARSSDTMEPVCPTSTAHTSMTVIDMLFPIGVTGIMGFIGLIYQGWNSRTLIRVVKGSSANLGHHAVEQKCVGHIAPTNAAEGQSLHEIRRRLDDQHEYLEKIHQLLASSQGQKNTEQQQPFEEDCPGGLAAGLSMTPCTTEEFSRL